MKYTGKDNAASFGASTWAAGIAFRDAVNAIVKRDGVNGVTRKSLLVELSNIHDFDAEGMIAPIDIAGRKVTECDVTLQVRDGEFVRVHPDQAGDLLLLAQERGVPQARPGHWMTSGIVGR